MRRDPREYRIVPIDSAWNEDFNSVTTANLYEIRDEDEPVSTRNSDEGDRPLGDLPVPQFALANKFCAILGSRDSLSLARENHLEGFLLPLSDSESDRDLEDLVLGEPRVPSKLSRPFGGLFHLGKRLSPLLEFEEREEVRIKLEPGLEEPSDADSDDDFLDKLRLSDFNVDRATPDRLIAPTIAIRAPTPDRKVLAEARPFPPPPPFGDDHRSAFVCPVPIFGRRQNINRRRQNQPFAGPRARHAGPRKHWEIGYGTRKLQVPNQVLWAALSAIFIIVAGAVTSNNNNICVVFLYLLLAFGGFMTVIFVVVVAVIVVVVVAVRLIVMAIVVVVDVVPSPSQKNLLSWSF